MGIFSRVRDFVAALASSPEDEVNRITAACARALEKGIPDEVKLQRFQEMAAKDVLLQGHYRLLLLRAQDTNKELTANEHVCMYIVAAATEVLALLGYDGGASWLRTDEENARMETSCRLRRTRIHCGNVEKEDLTNLLFQSLGVKALWQTSNILTGSADPRKELVQITGPEVEARDAWWRAHPMPENAGQNPQDNDSA